MMFDSSPRKRAFLPHTKFTLADDEQLRTAVAVCDRGDWTAIAFLVEGKSERQCKERWFNYLSPLLNTEPWTVEEDNLLLAKYAEFGSKWVKISRFFPRRTDSMVKNRFGILSRFAKKQKKIQEKENAKAVTFNEAAEFELSSLEERMWKNPWDETLTFQGCENGNWMD
jgi:hypothetical protein